MGQVAHTTEPPESLDAHLETTPGVCGGKPRIAGRRITVHDVALWHERLGRSADEIAAEHDLRLSDVYAALTYYFDHRVRIDEELADQRRFVEEMRQRYPSKLRAKLSQER